MCGTFHACCDNGCVQHKGSSFCCTYDVYSSVAVVRFTSNEYTVNEDDQNVQIGVELQTITERSIIVTLMLEPGSAQRK